MKKLGILVLPAMLTLSLVGCMQKGEGNASAGRAFSNLEQMTVENVRELEFKEKKEFNTETNKALMKAATTFLEDYHDVSVIYGDASSHYSGNYENSYRQNYERRIVTGKNYYFTENYRGTSAGKLVYRSLENRQFVCFKKGVEYFHNSSNTLGNQYWTYTDVTQEEFDSMLLSEKTYDEGMIYHNYTAQLINETFDKVYNGYADFEYGVLSNGEYAIRVSEPRCVYNQFAYTVNGVTYVGHDYQSFDIIITFKMNSKGRAVLTSGYYERGAYYDYQYIDGTAFPMEDGKLFYYGGDFYGFLGNSTKDLGVDHYLAEVPKKQQYVELTLTSYSLNEAGALVSPSTHNYTPVDDYNGGYYFGLSIAQGKPFTIDYLVTQYVLKNGEYVAEDDYLGEITKLEVVLGLQIERLEDSTGKEYFLVSPNGGTINIQYDFKVDTKKKEAVQLYNPIAVPYYY